MKKHPKFTKKSQSQPTSEPPVITIDSAPSDAKPQPAPKPASFNLANSKPRFNLREHKKLLIILTAVFLAVVGAVITLLLIFHHKSPDSATDGTTSSDDSAPEPPKYYSNLSGLEISDPKLNNSPTYCMQIPNGADYNRQQAGLTQAPVVFEAIAEAGITRFAAIFQNPTSSTIGPIRSLRLYYLDWDTPFDCTIVHAGGADDAIAAVRAGGYRDLSEDYDYMWRGAYPYYAPNNLFTSSQLLAAFNSQHNYNSSNPTSFARLLPAEAAAIAADNLAAANPATDGAEADCTTEGTETDCVAPTPVPLVNQISINFGRSATYNTVYRYDSATNTYPRAYADGTPHQSYNCPADLKSPNPATDCGAAVQIAPSAIVAMMVKQTTASDRYHQNITTTGSGTAYIFQNGQAIKGTWEKPDRASQISFRDETGNTVALTPGQAWIAAVPTSTGSVSY